MREVLPASRGPMIITRGPTAGGGVEVEVKFCSEACSRSLDSAKCRLVYVGMGVSSAVYSTEGDPRHSRTHPWCV